MCGIFFCRSAVPLTGKRAAEIAKCAESIKHRGPDSTRTQVYTRAVAVFHRLQIVDTTGGEQPFRAADWLCMINGEIYNYRDLYAKIDPEFAPKSGSDCEVVLSLFLTYMKAPSQDGVQSSSEGPCSAYEALRRVILEIDGEYAVVLYNIAQDYIVAFTDELRMRPLFFCAVPNTYSYDYYLVSEQKAAPGTCWPLHPGTIYIIGYDPYTVRRNHWPSPTLQDHPFIGGATPSRDLSRASNIICGHHMPDRDTYHPLDGGDIIAIESPVQWLKSPVQSIDSVQAATMLRDLIVDNVHAKMHSDRGYGFLLSGGIDSSLICGIAAKYCRDRCLPRIRTFTVGFSDHAPDILAARTVAAYIDSVHSEIIVPYRVGLEMIPRVIRQIESWDQTTIRASIPMMIAAEWIKKNHPDITVVYSGEVADELLRGYLYNRKEVSELDARADMRMRLTDISRFDGLRADRVIAGVGMEVRFPFFSRKLLQFVMSLPWEYLNPPSHAGVEKWLLRQAFAGTEYIPEQILSRTKNAFSDATSVMLPSGASAAGSEWKEMLKRHAEQHTTVDRIRDSEKIYPGAKIQTSEDMYYMDLFSECNYNPAAIPYKWLPSWSEGVTDSSATVLPVYSAN